MSSYERLSVEHREHLCLIGLNRAEKRNAFDLVMLRELSQAFADYERSPKARCAVLYAQGDHFTAGLDLAEVGPAVRDGATLFPEDGLDPLGLYGSERSKPVVMAIEGWCLTIGIELALAMDIRVASRSARFGQIEINRGIFPFGGATLRLPRTAGWGNAMRWLLTGDIFDAEEAKRLGLVQEVTAEGAALDRAIELAQTIASRAPLGVQATLRSARQGLREGFDSAAKALPCEARALMNSRDAEEGMRSFIERRDAQFEGS
jgi:enoyl-CoA hydratase